MITIKLEVKDKFGNIIKESMAQDEASLIIDREYAEGDQIVLNVSKEGTHIIWQADDAVKEAMCYIEGEIVFRIPFGEERKNYSERSFKGIRHYICARIAKLNEIGLYRNLAVNSLDQYQITEGYPHASESVGERKQWNFVPANAIDGLTENTGHGVWPYTAWGTNACNEAKLKIDFGRMVEIDCIKIWLRADFPHDSWWTRGIVNFSDGSREIFDFKKTGNQQIFDIRRRKIEWITFHNLKKANDQSLFPALTQIAIYGKELTLKL